MSIFEVEFAAEDAITAEKGRLTSGGETTEAPPVCKWARMRKNIVKCRRTDRSWRNHSWRRDY
jgi:hypothetical protein